MLGRGSPAGGSHWKLGGLAALSEAEQQDERARRKRADFTDGLDLIVVRFVILSCAENRNGFTPSLGLYLYRTQIAVGVGYILLV